VIVNELVVKADSQSFRLVLAFSDLLLLLLLLSLVIILCIMACNFVLSRIRYTNDERSSGCMQVRGGD